MHVQHRLRSVVVGKLCYSPESLLLTFIRGRGIGEVGKENSGLLKWEASLFRPAGWLMLLFAGVRGSHT